GERVVCGGRREGQQELVSRLSRLAKKIAEQRAGYSADVEPPARRPRGGGRGSRRALHVWLGRSLALPGGRSVCQYQVKECAQCHKHGGEGKDAVRGPQFQHEVVRFGDILDGGVPCVLGKRRPKLPAPTPSQGWSSSIARVPD